MTKSPQIMPKYSDNHHASRTIVIFAFDDAQLLDITGPLQVFATANELSDTKPLPYRTVIVAQKKIIKTSSGLQLCCEPLSDINSKVDTVLISGGCGIDAVCASDNVLSWVSNVYQRTRRIGSVCSGALLLATLGLLDGKKATTHWRRIAEVKQRFPDVCWQNDAIFAKAGNIWTSAGITAGIDMALAMVEEDLGFAIAKSVAQQLVVYLRRPGGQSQFSEMLDLFCSDDRFNILNQWIIENLSKPISVSMLADRCAMSERNFSRLYTRATGRTPAKAIELLRLEAARHYIEQNLPMKTIVQKSGFGSEETLRKVFQRHLAVSPQAYRDRFRNIKDKN